MWITSSNKTCIRHPLLRCLGWKWVTSSDATGHWSRPSRLRANFAAKWTNGPPINQKLPRNNPEITQKIPEIGTKTLMLLIHGHCHSGHGQLHCSWWGSSDQRSGQHAPSFPSPWRVLIPSINIGLSWTPHQHPSSHGFWLQFAMRSVHASTNRGKQAGKQVDSLGYLGFIVWHDAHRYLSIGATEGFKKMRGYWKLSL